MTQIIADMVQISDEAHVTLTLAGILMIVPGTILLVATLIKFYWNKPQRHGTAVN